MLSIFKGNDKTFDFVRMDTAGNIIKTIPQKLWFTLKASEDAEGFLFQKHINSGIFQNADGSWRVEFYPEDTGRLKSGKYWIDIKVKDEYGKEYTIVEPQWLAVLAVSTNINNQGG